MRTTCLLPLLIAATHACADCFPKVHDSKIFNRIHDILNNGALDKLTTSAAAKDADDDVRVREYLRDGDSQGFYISAGIGHQTVFQHAHLFDSDRST